jgi:predicted component of type VI protein secretion system
VTIAEKLQVEKAKWIDVKRAAYSKIGETFVLLGKDALTGAAVAGALQDIKIADERLARIEVARQVVGTLPEETL